MLRILIGWRLIAAPSVFTWYCGAVAAHLDRWRGSLTPFSRLRWRTPALRDSVQRLTLNPTATARLCGPMLQRARA